MTSPAPRGERLLAIAHRSGNSTAGLRAALDVGVDLVETDVHAHRGHLEVRHHKTLGPAHLWDKWEIVRRDEFVRLELAELLEVLDGDHRLMIDLKGIDRALAPAVAAALDELAPTAPVTVCTQHWWMLGAFHPPVRPVLSAASRRGLARLLRRLAAAPAYGVSVRLRLLTPDVVTALRARTEVVMAWPVDTPEALARARRLGVDAVIGKDLDLLGQVLADRR
jgi:glycerophosphoryl diester phosphodiesterase